MRNGRSTSSLGYSRPGHVGEKKRDAEKREKRERSSSKGLHESWAWYDACYLRTRNKGGDRKMIEEKERRNVFYSE